MERCPTRYSACKPARAARLAATCCFTDLIADLAELSRAQAWATPARVFMRTSAASCSDAASL